MTRHSHSLDADYFESMFQGDDDPWSLESSAYEAAKFCRSLSALGGRHYARAFEVGCAGGSLTQKLADSADGLLAVDVSETALGRARKRCADLPQIQFERMTFPAETPSDKLFDLIVMSEVSYYWDDADLARAAAAALRGLETGGDLLLVHFTGDTDYPQSGDEAVEKLWSALGESVDVLLAERHDRYRLDLWRRR